MTLMHSWRILWCGLDRTEVFITVIYTGMQNDTLYTCDQNSLFSVLHGRLNKLCNIFWRLMTFMHSWLILWPGLAETAVLLA